MERYRCEEKGGRLLEEPLETRWTGRKQHRWMSGGDYGWPLCIPFVASIPRIRGTAEGSKMSVESSSACRWVVRVVVPGSKVLCLISTNKIRVPQSKQCEQIDVQGADRGALNHRIIIGVGKHIFQEQVK